MVARRTLLATLGPAVLAVRLGAPAIGDAAGRRPLLMIDPGHGGKDPGCTGVNGIEEKDITLKVGLDLRRALAATGRVRVEMTRTRDVFITLADRVDMAIKAGASAFISLHCNHLADSAERGALIFTLSNHPSDALAARIARAENSYDQGPALKQYRDVSPRVRGILGHLQLHATERAARILAHDIVDSFQHRIDLLPDPHRSANFAVLRDPYVPATLIEMGCLSNRRDAALLDTLAYRKHLAGRIRDGVLTYFRTPNPERVAG
jgi:N-acetylmuramoyl-L-alanine amidase